MTLQKQYNLLLDTEETILCGSILNERSCALQLSDGHVIKWNLDIDTLESLFSTQEIHNYPDGGFDLTSPCVMYSMDDIVVVANEFKAHAFVYKLGHKGEIRLQRGTYHMGHCSYPIALFKNDEGVPHLIYAQDWNHIQIVNLNTGQLLTAEKSLIEVGAEKQYDKYVSMDKGLKSPWPIPYDYFFARLSISPDRKKFLSRGWGWGSADDYNVYDIEHFITNSRILEKEVMWSEHENRAACWVDEDTIAVAHNERAEPEIEGDSEITKLYLYDIRPEESTVVEKIDLDAFDLVKGQLYFSKSLNCFVVLSSKGLTVCSRKGEILLVDASFKAHSFNPELNLFLCIDGNKASMWKLAN